jgi:hypothetical protein
MNKATNEQAAEGERDELAALRQRVQQLEADNASMREIVLRVAEARMARDPVTNIESCLHCSLKRAVLNRAWAAAEKQDELASQTEREEYFIGWTHGYVNRAEGIEESQREQTQT